MWHICTHDLFWGLSVFHLKWRYITIIFNNITSSIHLWKYDIINTYLSMECYTNYSTKSMVVFTSKQYTLWCGKTYHNQGDEEQQTLHGFNVYVLFEWNIVLLVEQEWYVQIYFEYHFIAKSYAQKWNGQNKFIN